MTKAAQRIRDLAEQLAPEQQQVLLDIAESLVQPARFYDGLTDEQRADLARSLEEADRGEGVDRGALERRLDAVLSGRDA